MSDADEPAPTRILVVDNYDSFAYNLVQYVGEVADEVIVRRNDEVDLAAVRDLDPTGVVVSPGPGTPQEAGISIPLFERTSYPTLGVCLGHQALCAANGSRVVHAPEVVHGKPSVVGHDGDGLFAGLPSRFQVGRYHSLAVERRDLPDSLEETARTVDERGVLMAVRHREKPHVGVQFHPESILTRRRDGETAARRADGESDASERPRRGEDISLEVGKRMIANFCRLARTESAGPSSNREEGGEPSIERNRRANESDGDDRD
ncbi:anthranilate synthase component II [Natrarchaeobius oligotrophus]|uniref:anthranilate synthase n=1 Tax=Natrarchaeobius chitinivorans TaxID=1679083 RepID=A0A3N6MGQ2_NATCH|nr:aminodeoxychorismate/anthranilate synthase component II [Natrarchaeobius chitinivorans]RQH03254.1 aminodeoxychorismate/anthranilate synthase component II [Natrarchaeobius chitinivorans]